MANENQQLDLENQIYEREVKVAKQASRNNHEAFHSFKNQTSSPSLQMFKEIDQNSPLKTSNEGKHTRATTAMTQHQSQRARQISIINAEELLSLSPQKEN